MCVKLLFDQNLSYRLVSRIENSFPNSMHVASLGLDRASDFDIWKYAKEKGYVMVTKDSDFNDLCALYDFPPHIIWLKLGNSSVTSVEKALQKHHDYICDIIAAKQSGIIEVNA